MKLDHSESVYFGYLEFTSAPELTIDPELISAAELTNAPELAIAAELTSAAIVTFSKF